MACSILRNKTEKHLQLNLFQKLSGFIGIKICISTSAHHHHNLQVSLSLFTPELVPERTPVLYPQDRRRKGPRELMGMLLGCGGRWSSH